MTGPDGQISSQPLRMRPLIASIASVSAVGMAIGLGIPLLSVIMEKQGHSGTIIGANTAVAGLAALATAPVATAIARRFGLTRALCVAIIVSALSFFAFSQTNNLILWFVLRAIIHSALTLVFIYSEFWINSSAPPEKRGLVFGIYATVLSLGFALGPLIYAATGSEGILPFLIGTLIILFALIPLIFAFHDGPLMEESASQPFRRYLFMVPIATLAVFVFGAAETGGMALFPIYGLGIGYTEADTAILLSMFGLGNVFLQVPLGLMSDKAKDRRVILLGCGLVCVAGSLALPFAEQDWWLIAFIMFFFGGAAAGLYTVGLAHLGTRLNGTDLAAANAAFVFCYALGMLAGPPVLGVSMDQFGPHGFAYALGVIFAAFVLFALYRLLGERLRA